MTERHPSPEPVHIPRQLLELSQLDQAEFERLRQTIAENHGAVEIWIHTHFDERNLQKERTTNSESAVRYTHLRQRLIKTLSNPLRLPVIALVPGPAENKDSLLTKYTQHYQLDPTHPEQLSPLYFVVTERNNATPTSEFPQFDSAAEDNLSKRDRNWQRFAQYLHALGATRLIVRGQNYRESPPGRLQSLQSEEYQALVKELNLPTTPIPEACVGQAVLKFHTFGFDISLSRVTYPQQPSQAVRTSLRQDLHS